MTIYAWPGELRPVGIEFDLLGQAASGPVSLIGNSQVASLDGGYWLATFSGISIVNRAAMLSFRRLRALIQGGAHQVLVPVCDIKPWPGGSPSTATATFDDGAFFSDGSVFSQSVITVDVVVAADVRTTRLEVAYTNVGDIVGGEYFSIGNHLYQIAQVLTDETPSSGADAVWQIVPPLRAAVSVSDHLELDHPVCLMRPVREAEMNLMTFRNKTGVWGPVFLETFEA